MDKPTFVKGMFILGEAYEKELGDNLMDVYYQFLRHMTPEQLERAARRHIARSPYFPKVSEILQAVREDLPSAVDAWNMLWTAAESGKKPEMDAVTERALTFIGGWEAMQYTDCNELRFRFKDFERAYLEGQTQELEKLSGRQEPVAALER
jgi:hypothetical protein